MKVAVLVSPSRSLWTESNTELECLKQNPHLFCYLYFFTCRVVRGKKHQKTRLVEKGSSLELETDLRNIGDAETSPLLCYSWRCVSRLLPLSYI